MSRINKPGNIFVGATLVGRHEGGLAGTVYEASDQLVGKYSGGDVWLGPTPPGPNSASYKNGVISNQYGTLGFYKDGRILNSESKEVGKYTGGDEGGAAGAFLLIF